ncbi:MAG: transposase-like zinc-binding domain-containing protein [Candidatus Kapaibacteriota bacterium]
MITETHIHSCGKCSSQNIVRNGRNRYGNQQYLCKRLFEKSKKG